MGGHVSRGVFLFRFGSRHSFDSTAGNFNSHRKNCWKTISEKFGQPKILNSPTHSHLLPLPKKKTKKHKNMHLLPRKLPSTAPAVLPKASVENSQNARFLTAGNLYSRWGPTNDPVERNGLSHGAPY